MKFLQTLAIGVCFLSATLNTQTWAHPAHLPPQETVSSRAKAPTDLNKPESAWPLSVSSAAPHSNLKYDGKKPPYKLSFFGTEAHARGDFLLGGTQTLLDTAGVMTLTYALGGILGPRANENAETLRNSALIGLACLTLARVGDGVRFSDSYLEAPLNAQAASTLNLTLPFGMGSYLQGDTLSGYVLTGLDAFGLLTVPLMMGLMNSSYDSAFFGGITSLELGLGVIAQWIVLGVGVLALILGRILGGIYPFQYVSSDQRVNTSPRERTTNPAPLNVSTPQTSRAAVPILEYRFQF